MPEVVDAVLIILHMCEIKARKQMNMKHKGHLCGCEVVVAVES